MLIIEIHVDPIEKDAESTQSEGTWVEEKPVEEKQSRDIFKNLIEGITGWWYTTRSQPDRGSGL